MKENLIYWLLSVPISLGFGAMSNADVVPETRMLQMQQQDEQEVQKLVQIYENMSDSERMAAIVYDPIIEE